MNTRTALCALALLAAACHDSLCAGLVTQHVDIHFDFDPLSGNWAAALSLSSHEDPGSGTLIPTESAALAARDSAYPNGERYTIPNNPAFSFLGAAPGSPVWILPQNDTGYTWPSFFNTQPPGSIASYQESDPRTGNETARWIKVTLKAVTYSGHAPAPRHFSTWQTDGFGGVIQWMATSDGIGTSDAFFMTEESHNHLNFGFTALGIYRIDFEASAFLGPGASNPTSSGNRAVTFAVGSFALWKATHFAGPDLVDPAITGTLADPDRDGLPLLAEYAFNMSPLSGETGAVPANGTAGLPAARIETFSGTPHLTLEFLRRKAATYPQVSYTPEFASSPDAATWTAGTQVSVTSVNATWERVTVRDNTPAIGTPRFARVRLTLSDSLTY